MFESFEEEVAFYSNLKREWNEYTYKESIMQMSKVKKKKEKNQYKFL